MPNLPQNPVVGETVLEDFEMIDFDSEAYANARVAWAQGGSVGPSPKLEDFPVSMGQKTNVYFWNGLCWLQWVHGDNPVNVWIPEDNG